jgi:hypothetical protein
MRFVRKHPVTVRCLSVLRLLFFSMKQLDVSDGKFMSVTLAISYDFMTPHCHSVHASCEKLELANQKNQKNVKYVRVKMILEEKCVTAISISLFL